MNEDAIRLILALVAEQPREVLERIEHVIRWRRLELIKHEGRNLTAKQAIAEAGFEEYKS